MKSPTSQKAKQIGGISARKIIVPIAISLAILHIMIVILIFQISISSSRLSKTMREYDTYVSDATSLMAGSSLRCETSNTFVLMPVQENGEINLPPLEAYAAELKQKRTGKYVAERFSNYKISDEIKNYVYDAAEHTDQMLETQLHAMALTSAVYPVPATAPYTDIPMTRLTDEEEKMPDSQKEATARDMILGRDYSEHKHMVSSSVAAASKALKQESGRKSAIMGRRISILRLMLWTVTIAIIIILVLVFLLFNNQLLMPLNRFVRLIDSDHSLNDKKGMQEVRLLASAYNDLLWRRDSLDEILRSAAETDTLTNLPNRYKFEQYLVEFGKSGYSLAVYLFDINYLKITNDKQGHYAGDILIKSAAECISSCFDMSAAGISGESYCFRFGGDEFAALVKNCSGEDARKLADRFEAEQKSRGISVSAGYAYTEEIEKTSFKALLDEADRQMYKQKNVKHQQGYHFTVPANMTV